MSFFGKLAGLAAGLLLAPAAAWGASLSVVHVFNEFGQEPSKLVIGSDGDLYGVVIFGGTIGPDGATLGLNICKFPYYYQGPGLMFKVTPAGSYSEVPAFSTLPVLCPPLGNYAGAEGDNPWSLIAGPNGIIYGFDAHALGSANGIASLFIFTPAVPYLVVPRYTFARPQNPTGYLVASADGNLYGTTNNVEGSTGANTPGIIYKLSGLNLLSTVYALPPGGGYLGGLIQASDGYLYGVIHFPGAIYRLSTGGAFTLLHSFGSAALASDPSDTLVQGPDGSLYGSAGGDGTDEDGIVFRITPAGAYSVLHTFHQAVDGGGPTGLLLGRDGSLYGVTTTGPQGPGTVFRMSLDGTVTTLATLPADIPLQYPESLTQTSDGNLWGTAVGGSESGGVFKVTLP